MNINCENCNEVFSKYLCDIPSKWRDQIVTALCKAVEEKYTIACADVKKCETLTSLSSFTVSGSEVSITFKDENGVSWVRTFDMNDLISSSLDAVDPKCVASQEDWDSWTFTERVQAIINKIEECICLA